MHRIDVLSSAEARSRPQTRISPERMKKGGESGRKQVKGRSKEVGKGDKKNSALAAYASTSFFPLINGILKCLFFNCFSFNGIQ